MAIEWEHRVLKSLKERAFSRDRNRLIRIRLSRTSGLPRPDRLGVNFPTFMILFILHGV